MSEEQVMTEDDLNEIVARLMDSSAGSRSYSSSPWRVSTEGIDDGWLVASLGTDSEDSKDYYIITDGIHASELRGGAAQDAAFIAQAPNDIKDLVTEVKRCWKLMAEYQKSLSRKSVDLDAAIKGLQDVIKSTSGEFRDVARDALEWIDQEQTIDAIIDMTVDE